MKFIYIDESGSRDPAQGDIFVMAGLLIDAFRLRKQTANFDNLIQGFLGQYPRPPKEIKTKAMINGASPWNKVNADKRKEFLEEAVDLAVDCTEIYAVAFSLEKFQNTVQEMSNTPPFGTNYWVGAAMFLAALVQKKMQTLGRNKGHTVVVFDDNYYLPKVSACLRQADPWFDALYKRRIKKHTKGKDRMVWQPVHPDARFEQIINFAFSIKSEYSPFVQTADMISYIYKRHLELADSKNEKWPGEKDYYNSLVEKLDAKFKKLGLVAQGPCIDFYEQVKHPYWDF